jgi:hypothetical protein
MNAACQENLLACHLGHACHIFVSPAVGHRQVLVHYQLSELNGAEGRPDNQKRRIIWKINSDH